MLLLATSRRFPTKKVSDTDYGKDLALLSDNSYTAQNLLYILQQSAAFIGLHLNATKTKYMCYNPDGPIENLNKTPLKKEDHFVILRRKISVVHNGPLWCTASRETVKTVSHFRIPFFEPILFIKKNDNIESWDKKQPSYFCTTFFNVPGIGIQDNLLLKLYPKLNTYTEHQHNLHIILIKRNF